MKKKFQMCVLISLYGDNKLQRLREHVFSDPHFVGFNYYQCYRVFFVFDEDEDYVDFFETLKFKLSMGNKSATVTLLALVKGENQNFCFNLAYSEYLQDKSLFPGTDDYKTPV